MEKKFTKTCARCGAYKEYFSKAYLEFVREEDGFCKKKQIILNRGTEACEMFFWRGKTERLEDQKTTALRILDKMAIQLSSLKIFFGDEILCLVETLESQKREYYREKKREQLLRKEAEKEENKN